LNALIEGDMLEGDNAYYCEKCEKKVNAKKRCCIKKLPNVLMLVLKRFEFNYDTMTKFKVNDHCEFPMDLSMEAFCQETLQTKDLEKKIEAENLTTSDLSEDQQAILSRPKTPQQYYDYNLKGMVIHMGTAEQGHYYSFIQDRESPHAPWFEFNDSLVTPFDPAEIPLEAYGGEDESLVPSYVTDPAQAAAMKVKIKNAYVLIYERKEHINSTAFSESVERRVPDLAMAFN
jgi:ubiquitin carboxyl-terminal hydrolase 9/24